MKKELTKKILLTVGLALLIGVCLYLLGIQIYSIVSTVNRYIDGGRIGVLKIDYFLLIARFLFHLINVWLYFFLIVKIWKPNSNNK